MPTEPKTFKWHGRVVECVARYDFKDACRIRSRDASTMESIVSFSELQPHRTRKEYWDELVESRKRRNEDMMQLIERSISRGHRSITSIADDIDTSKRRVSKTVSEMEKNGRVVWDRSKQHNIRLASEIK